MEPSNHMDEQSKQMLRQNCVEMANQWAMKNAGSEARETLAYASSLYEFILNGKTAEVLLAEASKAA